VLVLLAATAAAFGVAERLKLERSPLTAPNFTRLIGPTCGCESGQAVLAVRLRKPDRVDVSIVDTDGDHVRTVATGVERRRGPARFRWDGRDDEGRVVPDGRYRVRFRLARADRTITVPTPIRVDATPPRLRLVSVEPRTLSPGAEGAAGRVLLVYRSSERAYPLLLVGGDVAVHGRSEPAGIVRLRWRGRIGGEPLRPGEYRALLVVVDPAGNQSAPSEILIRVE
jgi:hypothetical protein